jgi:hypothetical protein
MTANTPRRRRKRAFCAAALLAFAATAAAADPPPAWRLTVIPSFERREAIREKIPGSLTAAVAAARPAPYGELEFATTRGALRVARENTAANGGSWLIDANVEFRRDADRVIDRILVTSDDPLLPSVVFSTSFYERFEPLLGPGFHVVIPDRNTIALFPRFAGRIPPADAAALIEVNRLATWPVSREVFRATPGGLAAAGSLEE